jgi:hypothetical protein
MFLQVSPDDFHTIDPSAIAWLLLSFSVVVVVLLLLLLLLLNSFAAAMRCNVSFRY